MDEKGLDVTVATTIKTEQATKVSAECFKSVFMLEFALCNTLTMVMDSTMEPSTELGSY